MFKPNIDWGPKDLQKFNEWKDFKQSKKMLRGCTKKSKITTILFGED